MDEAAANHAARVGASMRALASRLVTRGPATILETACGTGILTSAVAEALSGVPLTATDLNDAMIEEARRTWTAGSRHPAWQTADMLALPCPHGAFAAVVCQFRLMFAARPARGCTRGAPRARAGRDILRRDVGAVRAQPRPPHRARGDRIVLSDRPAEVLRDALLRFSNA